MIDCALTYWSTPMFLHVKITDSLSVFIPATRITQLRSAGPDHTEVRTADGEAYSFPANVETVAKHVTNLLCEPTERSSGRIAYAIDNAGFGAVAEAIDDAVEALKVAR